MERLPQHRSLEARSDCLCVVVLKLGSTLGLLHHLLTYSNCHFRALPVSASLCLLVSVLHHHRTPQQHEHPIHCTFTPDNQPEPSFSASRLHYPTNHFRTCLPPPQNLLRALLPLSPRRKSLSAPLRPTIRRPRKMTTTRTRTLMTPKAKGKKLVPRAKNTMLLENHTLLQRNMPKTQAASRKLMQASDEQLVVKASA
jgi:hypothetical protein